MGLPQLPPEIHAKILQDLLRVEPLDSCLRLRLVNKHFSREVSHVLFDQGEVGRRLYKDVIQRRQVHAQFACKYWEAFFRKPIPIHHHRRRRRLSSRRSRSLSSSNDTAENSSGSDSQGTGSRESRDVARSQSTYRLNQIRAVIHSAIAMECSLRPTARLDTNKAEVTKIKGHHDPNLEASLTAICTAACQLLGGKDSMIYLSKNRFDLRDAGLRSRHLVGKPCEFWVLLSAVWSRDFELAEQYLNHFRVKHRKEAKWLTRLGHVWNLFSWRSSNRERQWLEVLAACLILAANIGATDFFRHLMDLEPGVCTIAFSGIRYGDRNALEATVFYNRSDMFELLIERQWCFVRSLDGDKPIDDYGRAVIIAGLTSSDDSRRDDIVRILFIMTDAWQQKLCVEMLLGHAAVRNDVKMIEMILTHSAGNESKLVDTCGTRQAWQCHDTGNVLLIAARLQNMDFLRVLLRYRSQIIHVVPATARFTDIGTAVSGLVSDGEPVPLACLEEILRSSDDALVQEQFFLAAQTLSAETVAVFARNMNLDKLYSRSPPVIMLDNGEEIVLIEESAEREQSWETDTTQTVGERALCMALSALKVHIVRMLIEEFGVRLTWGAVHGLHVWEHETEGVGILDELSMLLAEHGMFMQTKVIYAPSFHPSAGSSTQTEGGIRRQVKAYESESEGDEIEQPLFGQKLP